MNHVATPAPISVSKTDEDGCLVAVESPIYQPIVVHHGRGSKKNGEELRFAASTTTTTTTTPTPNIFNAARGYIEQKYRKVKDHVQERMVMFYLPRAPPRPFVPPTAPTTTPKPTTQPPPPIPVQKAPFKPSCPKPNGLFPHEEDCRKFINCWRGAPHILTCAPGTLFNPVAGNCDHAANVNCQSNYCQ